MKPLSGSLQNDEQLCRDHVHWRDSHSDQLSDGVAKLLHDRPGRTFHRWLDVFFGFWKTNTGIMVGVITALITKFTKEVL